jgi:DNA-directed RNA polymerase subunit RPC12/RpoP
MPDAPDTVLTDCAYCPTMIEVETGERGIEQAIAAGWEIQADGDIACPACSRDRAEAVEDYW